MKNAFIFLLVCFAFHALAQEDRVPKFTIVTGAGDLRSDENNAFFTLNLTEDIPVNRLIRDGSSYRRNVRVLIFRVRDAALSKCTER
ncbi:MAG: hypothetical protein ACK4TA_11775 [Saprospiraceae bacterium]